MDALIDVIRAIAWPTATVLVVWLIGRGKKS